MSLALRRIPIEADQRRRERRGNDFDVRHRLARQRIVVESARDSIQIPLTRLVQFLEDVLDIVPLLPLPVPHGPGRRLMKLDQAGLGVHGADMMDGGLPGMIDNEDDFAQIVPFFHVAFVEIESARIAFG